ncbi:MAG: thiopurine S-methyltransferase, partial [Acinetobacter sp.]|nr:thiopurine S-methyltransferase [Acinetobacter sp.]
MKAEFWHERWSRQEIGFHRKQVHPLLHQFFDRLRPEHHTIFVPLCGKSIDMLWLADHGLQVVGSELSKLAVSTFFEENKLTQEVLSVEPLQGFRSERVLIWQGDYFALLARHLNGASCFYDRAALVALPADMRTQYVEKLNTLMPMSAEGLLITFDYDTTQMDGPPFAVPTTEVYALFANEWEITNCSQQDV